MAAQPPFLTTPRQLQTADVAVIFQAIKGDPTGTTPGWIVKTMDKVSAERVVHVMLMRQDNPDVLKSAKYSIDKNAFIK